MKYNIGSGDLKKEGYTNVDLSTKCRPEIVADITKTPWNWANPGAERIEADNLFEHIEPHTLIEVINECHRILKPGGRLWLRVPFVKFTPENLTACFTDPTHVNYFTEGTFDYWNKDHARHRAFGKDYGIKPWKVIRNSEWEKKSIFLIVELEKC